jgi:integrase/recombinase XerD
MRSSKLNCEVVSVTEASLDPAIREVCSVIRRYRLTYDQLAYVLKSARRRMEIVAPRRVPPLPKALSEDQLQRFFAAIRKSGNAEHELLFRMMYVTGARVSEVAKLKFADIDLALATVRIELGKGAKSRIVMIPASLLLTLRVHIQSRPAGIYLFETRRRGKFSCRWIQELARRYGNLAGISNMHPHRLRHSILTKLAAGVELTDGTRIRGMSDAQLQVISGHSQRRSLEVYSRLGLAHVRDHFDALMQEDKI